MSIFSSVGFVCLEHQYVHRRTTNIKEGVDAARVFLQAKFTYDPTTQDTLSESAIKW